MDNQSTNNTLLVTFRSKRAIVASSSSIVAKGTVNPKPKKWAKLRSKVYRIKEPTVPVFSTNIQPLAQNFQVERGALYYNSDSYSYSLQFTDSNIDENSLQISNISPITLVSSNESESPASSTQVSLVENFTISAESAEIAPCAVEQENHHKSSLLLSSTSSEIPRTPLTEINGVSSHKDNITASNEPDSLEAEVTKFPTKLPSVVTVSQPLASEAASSFIDQSAEEAISEPPLSIPSPISKFHGEVKSIYETFSSNHGELANNLFTLFTRVYNSSLDSDEFIDTVTYWLNYNQGFNINESAWRECTLKNDDILFTVGKFLNHMAQLEDGPDISPIILSPIILLLSMISNHTITRSRYCITESMVRLSIKGGPIITNKIIDILESVMDDIKIPLKLQGLQASWFDSIKISCPISVHQNLSIGITDHVKSLIGNPSLKRSEAMVNAVSFISRIPREYMVFGNDLFEQLIVECLGLKSTALAVDNTQWLHAALKCPEVYHKFKEYFEIKIEENDDLVGSPVLQMFKIMKSHLIFLPEFDLIHTLLALVKVQTFQGDNPAIFKIFNYEERQFRTMLKNLLRDPTVRVSKPRKKKDIITPQAISTKVMGKVSKIMSIFKPSSPKTESSPDSPTKVKFTQRAKSHSISILTRLFDVKTGEYSLPIAHHMIYKIVKERVYKAVRERKKQYRLIRTKVKNATLEILPSPMQTWYEDMKTGEEIRFIQERAAKIEAAKIERLRSDREFQELDGKVDDMLAPMRERKRLARISREEKKLQSLERKFVAVEELTTHPELTDPNIRVSA